MKITHLGLGGVYSFFIHALFSDLGPTGLCFMDKLLISCPQAALP